MTKQEQIQLLYKQVRLDANGNTKLCFEFLNWLHYEMGEVNYLVGMDDLSVAEEQYIDQLLAGLIPRY